MEELLSRLRQSKAVGAIQQPESPVGWGGNPNTEWRLNVGVRRLTPTYVAASRPKEDSMTDHVAELAEQVMALSVKIVRGS